MTKIYLSYAYVDNQDFHDGHKGWINEFREDLETKLAFASGQIIPISFFLDKQFGKPNLLNIKYIKSTQIFLIIGTPAYFYSDFCQSELKLFLKRSEADTFQKIVFINKIPFDDADFLSHLPVDNHHQFYHVQSDLEFSRRHLPKKYFSKIEKVAKQIISNLS